MALGVGVIGAGTVGGGVIETLLNNAGVLAERAGLEVRLTHVAELRSELLTDFNLDGVTVSQDAKVLIADPDVQVVCELIGGETHVDSCITAIHIDPNGVAEMRFVPVQEGDYTFANSLLFISFTPPTGGAFGVITVE